MGGGGGYRGYTSTQRQTSPSMSGSQASEQEIEINKFLEELLKDINSRDAEAINKHLEEIQKVLSNEITGLEKILFGGSIAKNTFIEGTSDVDALVFLDETKYRNTSPKELQNAFYDMLRQRFPMSDISKGELAVTIRFSDYEIQLLPAIKKGDKVCIADRGTTKWTKPIDTKAFTSKLTRMNQVNNNKLIPVIKISKALLSNLPDEYKLSGYHIEAMAVDIFRSYNGRFTLFDMTRHFLINAQKSVLTPTRDITGQSGIVDDYLGIPGSIERQKVARQIKVITEKFSGSEAVSVTKALFD